ncbi:MAG: carboxypeptidase-like regulatory domain-containing protein, partial [Planctomycetota bacterium]|nr:carboxypeptidase-like regulatory domain-containing protein [Planctomycetota bacterium]
VHDRSFRHASHAIASLPKDMGALVIQLEAVPHVVRTLQVQGTQGQPIESVVIDVSVEGGEGSMEERSGSAELSLPDPSWGPTSITVQAQGHLIREFEVADAGSLPEPWVIELQPAPGIRGTVVTPGKPRVRAEVSLLRQVKPERVSRKGNAISRAGESPAEKEDCAKDGTFFVNHPHDGAFVMIASARGFADALAVLPDYKAGEGQAGIVLEMNGGGELQGTVLDSLGQPVPRAFLVLNHEFHKLRRKRAGKDGSFRFSGVPEGDWILRTVEDFDSEFFGSTIQVTEDWKFPMNCQVVAGEVTRFDLHLPDPNGSAVRGFWSGEGEEAMGWTVLLSTSYGGIFGGDPFATRWSEEQPLVAGREFEFGVQRGRDYYVQLKAEGLAGMLSREILASELPAQLDPPSRFVTLRTTLPRDGAPRVSDLTLEWNEGPWALRTYLTANEDGTFGPTLVPVGSLNLTWQVPGADQVEGRTVEAAGGRELVIELQSGV